MDLQPALVSQTLSGEPTCAGEVVQCQTCLWPSQKVNSLWASCTGTPVLRWVSSWELLQNNFPQIAQPPKTYPCILTISVCCQLSLCCHQFHKAVLPNTAEKGNTHWALGEMKHGSPVITDRIFVSNSPSALLNVNLQCWHINLNDK